MKLTLSTTDVQILQPILAHSQTIELHNENWAFGVKYSYFISIHT